MNQEIANDIGNAVYRMTSWFERTSAHELFTQIPKQKKITYVTHVWRNMKQSVRMGYLAICLWLHAFFPFLFPFLADDQETPVPPVSETPSMEPISDPVLKPEKDKDSNESTAL